MVLPRATELPRVAAAARLLLRARALVRAMALGERRGARRGTGVEFLEHAEYVPGADVRRIDPLASARRDRLLVRTYREDARRTVHVLVDASPSMALAPRGDHGAKWDAARALALALVLAAARLGDSARLWSFSDHGAERIAPRGARAARAALALEALTPATTGTPTALDRALRDVAARARRGDALVVVSDLLALDASPLATVRALRARRHPVAVLHLLAAEDRALPAGPTRLVPVEGGGPLDLDGTAAAADYARAFEAFVARWRAALTEAGARVVRLDADRPLAPPLAEAVRALPPRP